MLRACHQHIGRKGGQAVHFTRIRNGTRLHVTCEIHRRAGQIWIGEQGCAVVPGLAQDGAGIGHRVVHEPSCELLAR